MIVEDGELKSYSPTICVTHKCNLNCVYCYQQFKNDVSMSMDTAKRCVNDIFQNIPALTETIEISFIGGEPLLEVELLKEIYQYSFENFPDKRLHFFATTNGTVLSDEDKQWFFDHRDRFILGLSLDGKRETHNYNRSGSYDAIDFRFFLETWPTQGPKMTISKESLSALASNIMHIHELGFKEINGVNFAEGDFDWKEESVLRTLAEQLKLLLDYYSSNFELKTDQMFGKHIEMCEAKRGKKEKTCGIGSNTIFYDVDGKKYPCSFVTPLTFDENTLSSISETDFHCSSNFVDIDCYENCYIYPVCTTCSGANYLVNGRFDRRNKERCDMNKLLSLFIAEYHARKILAKKEEYDENTLYYLIEAIKKIKETYYEKYKYLIGF